MSVVKCVQGHFYDDGKYSTCPHCSGGNSGNASGGNSAGTVGAAGMLQGIDRSSLNEEKTVAKASLDSGAPVEHIGGSVAAIKSRIGISVGDADEKTVGLFVKRTKADPVVGWLVCIEGIEKGRDYRLHSGRNFIGRSNKSDVAIVDDAGISRENHCSVVFDPKTDKYMLVPGLATLSYLNGVEMKEPATLNDGDTIEISASKFTFVAFCKGGRGWQ